MPQEGRTAERPDHAPVFEIARPRAGRARPLVFDSPHSGWDWPADFRPRAPRHSVATTCDRFMDELLGDVVLAGATLLAARFPRAYIDPDRAESDLDASMLADPWASPLMPSEFTRRGSGLIARDALPGVAMYDGPLAGADVTRRIEAYHRPYRAALHHMMDEAHAAHRAVWHVSCHAMAARGDRLSVDAGQSRPDVVVGDRMGTTANPALTARVVEWFDAQGFRVQMNDPFRGGDIIAAEGDPAGGRHCVQLWLNKALYMSERTFERNDGFGDVKRTLTVFAHEMAAWAASPWRLA